MKALRGDLPFKTGARRIVVVKDLPHLQCSACREYLIEDAVMEHVEELLKAAASRVELEVVPYAA